MPDLSMWGHKNDQHQQRRKESTQVSLRGQRRQRRLTWVDTFCRHIKTPLHSAWHKYIYSISLKLHHVTIQFVCATFNSAITCHKLHSFIGPSHFPQSTNQKAVTLYIAI